MNHLINTLQALGFVALIGIAGAIGGNDGDYAAPTKADIENDINSQRVDLCATSGWPDDANAKKAFEVACHGDLKRSPI